MDQVYAKMDCTVSSKWVSPGVPRVYQWIWLQESSQAEQKAEEALRLLRKTPEAVPGGLSNLRHSDTLLVFFPAHAIFGVPEFSPFNSWNESRMGLILFQGHQADTMFRSWALVMSVQ